MPGRSLPGNTSGRSMAPVASTTRRARTCHSRSRGCCAGRSARWSVMRSFKPDEVVREVAECGGSGEQRHARVARAARAPTAAPNRAPASPSMRAAASPSRLPPNSEDSSHSMTRHPDCGRGERCGKACRTCAHHQHIAMRVALRIAVGIGLGRRHAQPGGAANDGLVQRLPRACAAT